MLTPQRASRRASQVGSRRPSNPGSGVASPAPIDDRTPSRRSSFADNLTRRMAGISMTSSTPNNGDRADSPKRSDSRSSLNPLAPMASITGQNGTTSPDKVENDEAVFDEDDDEEDIDIDAIEVDVSDLTDNSVKILPGVRRLFDSIPRERVAVATSGAKTYC